LHRSDARDPLRAARPARRLLLPLPAGGDAMGFAIGLTKALSRTVGTALVARAGSYRTWPSNDALIDAPLALAEARTTGLRRIYANGHRDAWDGSAVFRDAVAKHGGTQPHAQERGALVHPLTMLMWGELGAWIVSDDLARRLRSDAP